jgi:hypothetical protein
MFILSYPFISIGISTLCFVAGKLDNLISLCTRRLTCDRLSGLLMAAARSEVAILRYGGYTRLVGPLSCAFLFVWIAQK